MPSLSNKAQFFLLTAVIIAGFFYTTSRYINPYSFIDTSKSAKSDEIFFFNNLKDKVVKTVAISKPNDLPANLNTYKNYIEGASRDKGYVLVFNYNNTTSNVGIKMILQSSRMTLTSDFIVRRP